MYVCTLNPFILRGGDVRARGGMSQRGGPKDSIKKQGKPMQINTNSATSIEFYTISSKIIKNQQKHKKCVKYKKNQRNSQKNTQNVHKSTKNDVLGREAFFLKSISFYKDKSLGDAPARGGDAPARGGCPSAGSRSMRGFRVRTYVRTLILRINDAPHNYRRTSRPLPYIYRRTPKSTENQ